MESKEETKQRCAKTKSTCKKGNNKYNNKYKVSKKWSKKKGGRERRKVLTKSAKVGIKRNEWKRKEARKEGEKNKNVMIPPHFSD